MSSGSGAVASCALPMVMVKMTKVAPIRMLALVSAIAESWKLGELDRAHQVRRVHRIMPLPFRADRPPPISLFPAEMAPGRHATAGAALAKRPPSSSPIRLAEEGHEL